MRRRTAGLAAAAAALVVAAVLIGVQVLATSGSQAPRATAAAPAAATQSADDTCDEAETGECGNEHSKAVRAWARCKNAQDKDAQGKAACVKPQPSGQALGHTKHLGKAPGPASADGRGHAWGRAHAPGQLKTKPQQHDADEEQGPERGS